MHQYLSNCSVCVEAMPADQHVISAVITSTQIEGSGPTEEVLPLTKDQVQGSFMSLEMGTSETVAGGLQAAAFDP